MKKKLSYSFTTPEQSKRLLELGVPKWSADEYRDQKGYRHSLDGILDVELFFQNFPDYLPCWSVGRLIEIITICCNHYSGNNDIIFNRAAVNHGLIECLVAYLAIEKKDVSVDFSKLED